MKFKVERSSKTKDHRIEFLKLNDLWYFSVFFEKDVCTLIEKGGILSHAYKRSIKGYKTKQEALDAAIAVFQTNNLPPFSKQIIYFNKYHFTLPSKNSSGINPKFTIVKLNNGKWGLVGSFLPSVYEGCFNFKSYYDTRSEAIDYLKYIIKAIS